MTVPNAVTVIIRSTGHRTRAASLRRAVASVLSQRGAQTHCLVVFNGNEYDPKTIEWVRSQPHTSCLIMDGPDKPAATFIGRALVATDLFCYLDDDDELLPEALERRLHIMAERPQLDCVATNGYYVQGNTTRLLFEQTQILREHGYVQSLLHAHNWLASCGGLFRTSTVKMSYFQNLPPHREWTVIAFRIASSLHVHFEDTPTFRVNSSPGSQSKQDSYVDAGIVILDELKRCTNDPQQRNHIRDRQAAAYRSMCSYYRLRKNFPAAWRAYVNAIRSQGGWRYIPYIARMFCRETGVSFRELFAFSKRDMDQYRTLARWALSGAHAR